MLAKHSFGYITTARREATILDKYENKCCLPNTKQDSQNKIWYKLFYIIDDIIVYYLLIMWSLMVKKDECSHLLAFTELDNEYLLTFITFI